MRYPKAIQNLIDQLAGLPSVGPKTAERYAFYLWRQKKDKLIALADSIRELQEKTIICQTCFSISETDPCSICSDANRISDLLCIVENTQDLLAIEATKQFSGRYFVLGGLINTINDISPEDLNMEKLFKYIKAHKIQEIILALNFTLEGETTSLYLNKALGGHLRVTRLAKGLPAGSDLEYADENTLASALKYRLKL